MAAVLVWLGALIVGLSLGLLGSGGSILTVPALLYLADQPEKLAIVASLAIVGTVALVGAAPYARRGELDWRSTLLFGLPGIAGAWLGAQLAQQVSGTTQIVVFALVMLWAALMMLRGSAGRSDPAAVERISHGVPFIVLNGTAVGLLTGFVGVGGGFLILPALVLIGGLGMRVAIGTSLSVIALNAWAGFAKHYLELGAGRGALDWRLILTFAGVGIIGSLAGQHFGRRLPQASLRRIFAWTLLLIGAAMLVQRLGPLLVPSAVAAR